MNKSVILAGWVGSALWVSAQSAAVNLPELTVLSPRVANQAPAGTFPAVVTALRYEPRVDLAGRNLAEAQADVTLRGGIFENTGFRLGAVSLFDPQTGHYLAEIPVAPTMLGAPDILTGLAHAAGTTNSTVGALAYGWRPIRRAGHVSLGGGDFGFNRQEIYQGVDGGSAIVGGQGAADFAWARSASAGVVPWGEHRFERMNVRLQWRGPRSQTDLVGGYQEKFFGWPNLYTPFNSNESENLQTRLWLLNHRVDLGGGDFVEGGVWDRRNKDDYAFNRFAAVGAVHPFQHTTWARGAAVGGRRSEGELALGYRAEVLADELRSTSLTAGRYRTRTITKFAVVPERSWTLAGPTDRVSVRAGATYDDSNRAGGAWSPLVEVARETTAAAWRRLYFSYAQSTQLPTYTALNSSATAGLFRGNPNLGRERSRNIEAGVEGNWAGWTGQLAGFHRQDDGLVDWTFRRGVTARAANAVDIATTGFEAVLRRSTTAVDLVLGYTALSKDADYRGATVDASFYALNYARHRLTAAVTARLGGGWELRIDTVARVQADNFLRVIGGDEALTSSLGVTYRPAQWRGVEFSALVDNAWDSRFQDVPAVPAARRQFSVGVSYHW